MRESVIVKLLSDNDPVVTWKTFAEELKEDGMVSVAVEVASSSFWMRIVEFVIFTHTLSLV